MIPRWYVCMTLIDRPQDVQAVARLMGSFPVTAILGPRQCGKTTLARCFGPDHSFDLENLRDLARLEQSQLALEDLRGLIVIDEIQRMPDIFPLLRYLVDRGPGQKYLILGGASRDLLRQSSETLAGRIACFQLGGFRLGDVGPDRFPTCGCGVDCPRPAWRRPTNGACFGGVNIFRPFSSGTFPDWGSPSRRAPSGGFGPCSAITTASS
jgi:hypothetical protein